MTVKTQNGRDFYELLSALQKCIRRGLEYKAVRFAVEIEDFNPTALWNKLETIASEDIGLVNPLMPILIEVLRKQYGKAKENLQRLEKNEHRIFLVNAVVCLCHSSHSRITDDLLWIAYNEMGLEPIPDFALDGIHTVRETKEGRENWDLVVNEPFPNPYREKAKKIRGY